MSEEIDKFVAMLHICILPIYHLLCSKSAFFTSVPQNNSVAQKVPNGSVKTSEIS